MRDKPDLMSYVRGMGIGVFIAWTLVGFSNEKSGIKIALLVISFALLIGSLFIPKEGKK